MATTILLVTANPSDSARLRLDEELKKIRAALQFSKGREHFKIEHAFAATAQDLLDALIHVEPNIVHFSGHGEKDGLYFNDKEGNSQLLDSQQLDRLFSGKIVENVKCVVLNACKSEEQAICLSQHLGYVAGMSKEIGDEAAILFAEGFYTGLFRDKDGKLDFDFAFECGCRKIDVSGIQEWKTPKMLRRPIPYLENTSADVLIYASPEDRDWTQDFSIELHKYLNQEFGSGRAIHLYDTQPDSSKSKVHLFVSSKHSEHLSNSWQADQPDCKQFLIVQEGAAPEYMTGLSRYYFGEDRVSSSKYAETLRDLAKAIKDHLKVLKKKEGVVVPEAVNAPLVFILTEPDAEHVNYAKTLRSQFTARGFACAIPNLDDYGGSVKTIQKYCKGVLIVVGDKSHFGLGRSLEYGRSKKEQLKVIGVHADCTTSKKRAANLEDIHCAAPFVVPFPTPPSQVSAMVDHYAEELLQ